MAADRIRQAVMARLMADSALTGLVDDRIYPLVLPRDLDTYPAIAVTRVDGIASHSKGGPTGLIESRFQVSVWARRLLDCANVTDAVRSCLDGFRGDMHGVHVHSIRSAGEVDFYEQDVGLYQVASDYIISHERGG